MPILYNHAQEIVDENKLKTGLWLGTGSTKTRIALFLAQGKVLIVCPKTQFDDRNWQREIEKIQVEDKNFKRDISVISKEQFRMYADDMPAYDTVIIDEAHTCLGVTPNVRWIKKQPIPKASQLFESLDRYIQRTKPKRLYLCTATIIRSPMTVWAAAKLLGKDWNWYEWRNVFYFRLPMPGREVWVVKSDTKTKDRLARAVQKLGYTGQLSDYFDVPEQTYKTDYVDITTKQKARIKELPLEYPDPLVLIGKKHQIENGILSGDEFNKPEYFDNEKIDKLLDYAIEFPRMIVFAKYIAQIEQIALAMKHVDKKVFILTGNTQDRGSVIAEAQGCDNYVFIAQAQISAGWELPHCPVMIFASMSYSIVDRVQGEGRILRANALKKNLYIDLVVRNGVDEAVYEAIKDKKDFQERVYLEKDNI